MKRKNKKNREGEANTGCINAGLAAGGEIGNDQFFPSTFGLADQSHAFVCGGGQYKRKGMYENSYMKTSILYANLKDSL